MRPISSSVNFPTRPNLAIYGSGLDDAEGLELQRLRTWTERVLLV